MSRNNSKGSLTEMNFGGSKTERKSTFFTFSLHDAFKKVLDAIRNIKPGSSSNAKKKRRESTESFGSPSRKGLENPMLTSTAPPTRKKKRQVDDTFGAYNPNGMPTRAKKKDDPAPSEKNTSTGGIEAEIEEQSDFVSDNPRYLAKLRREEKQKRLAAGEDLEAIKKDFAVRKAKRKVKRSPLPPGIPI